MSLVSLETSRIVRSPSRVGPSPPAQGVAPRRGLAARQPAPRRPRARGSIASSRTAPARSSGLRQPVTLHLPLPARIVRMAELGLRHPAAQHEGWWRRVEEEMAHFVFSQVSPTARELRMSLDAERMEVVVRYAARDTPAAPRGRWT